jgi:hypothetical protein
VAEQKIEKTKKPSSLMKKVLVGTTIAIVVPTSAVFAGGFLFRGNFIPSEQTVTVKCDGKTVEAPKGSTVNCQGIEIILPKE